MKESGVFSCIYLFSSRKRSLYFLRIDFDAGGEL